MNYIEDEIVISGMSGKLPKSNNLQEFYTNLYNKVDMIGEINKKWIENYPEIPKQHGIIPIINKFDADFFDVSSIEANIMDPQGRILLESAYEAILDAGINPITLRGKNVGVFIACSYSETKTKWIHDQTVPNGYALTGCHATMLPNRISYSLGFNGPSMYIDTACSSLLYALNSAYHSIATGQCDSAILGTVNLCLHPKTNLEFTRLEVLSPDGHCKTFDKKANGYVRANTVASFYLQKMPDAKRNYATIIFSKTNCDGFKIQGINHPSQEAQIKLLTEFYNIVNIDTNTIDYFELHGTGTAVGDLVECTAVDSVFGRNRKKPLNIGSVKSNAGHAECSANALGIIKSIFALETGFIAPNISYNEARDEIRPITEGRFKICLEPTKLNGDLIGINGFGFGGANGHVLIRGNTKTKQQLNNEILSILVLWSGRTEQSIIDIFNFIESRPIDLEYIGLLHNIQSFDLPKSNFKGFAIYKHQMNKNSNKLTKEIKNIDGNIPDYSIVWTFIDLFVNFNVEQRIESLMKIPTFRKSFDLNCEILNRIGFNLNEELLTNTDTKLLDNNLGKLMGIITIQIGLADVLTKLYVPPNYIFGHSIGQLICGYVDKCLTREQILSIAYLLGNNIPEQSIETITGAIIEFSYEKLIKILPKVIKLIYFSKNKCFVIGLKTNMDKFLSILTRRDTNFQYEPIMNINSIIYYLTDLNYKEIVENLKHIILESGIKCSKKYLNVNLSPDFNSFSPEYLVYCLTQPISMDKLLTTLPNNSIILESIQFDQIWNIFSNEFPPKNNPPLIITLLRNDVDCDDNSCTDLLMAIGRLFLHGFACPKIADLYPSIEFPVSKGTAMVSPLIKWNHADDWYVLDEIICMSSGERIIDINIMDSEYRFLTGHKIDGRCILPAMGYLFFVWETFAHMTGKNQFNMNIEFEEPRFYRATSLSTANVATLKISIHYSSGVFEIMEGTSLLASGKIRELLIDNNTDNNDTDYDTDFGDEKTGKILANDYFYKHLYTRGYHYSDQFKSVIEASDTGAGSRIKWFNNWITFMDCMLQICCFQKASQYLLLPKSLVKVQINGMKHQKAIEMNNQFYHDCNIIDNHIIKSGGITMTGLDVDVVDRRNKLITPVLEEFTFIGYNPTPKLSRLDAFNVCFQILQEIKSTNHYRILETKTTDADYLIETIQMAVRDIPLVTIECYINIDRQDFNINIKNFGDLTNFNNKIPNDFQCEILIVEEFLKNNNEKLLRNLLKNIENSEFYIFSRESTNFKTDYIKEPEGFKLILTLTTDDELILVFRKFQAATKLLLSTPSSSIIKISSEDSTFGWLDQLRNSLKIGPVILVAQYDKYSGILGFINCIRRESYQHEIVMFFIDDANAKEFDINEPFYQKQCALGLPTNIYRNGKWGSYRYLKLKHDVEQELMQNDEYYYVINERKDLSSFKWVKNYLPCYNYDESVKVFYIALNFRDVMFATGRISDHDMSIKFKIGVEYSGIDLRNGKRVIGIQQAEPCLATYVVPDNDFMWTIPDNWSFQEAATVLTVYGTVYTAFFFTNCTIQRGQTILIHSGSGGIGLAAIRVAIAYDLKVFTTVSTDEKREFLLREFPTLKDSNIGYSRDTSFETMIKCQTNGQGVDYVINSLTDDKLQASIRCLKRGGTFLELGKYDIINNSHISFGHNTKEINYQPIFFDYIINWPSEKKQLFHRLIANDIKANIIKPIHNIVFQISEIENAFRYLTSGKHIGKVLIQIRDDITMKFQQLLNVKITSNFDTNKVYLVPGGLGGIGLVFINWLINRGARKIVICSRSGISTQYHDYQVNEWCKTGIHIIIRNDNIKTEIGCETLISECLNIAPLGGIFNLATVTYDGILENQTTEQFYECVTSKAWIAKYLDRVSRRLCPKLKYFVAFSTISCGRGNPGQSNYGLANSILERIFEERVSLGYSGKVVQWGTIAEVGLAAHLNDALIIKKLGVKHQPLLSFQQELDRLIVYPATIVSSIVLSDKYVAEEKKGGLTQSVLNVLGLRDLKSVSMTASLSQIGMDSLMSVELKQMIEREFDINLTLTELREITFEKLKKLEDKIKIDTIDGNVSGGVGGSGRGVIGDGNSNVNSERDAKFTLEFGDESVSDKILFMANNATNVSDRCIIFIPGLEAIASNLTKTLTSQLIHPTYVLQTLNINGNTIGEIVDQVIELVLAVIKKYRNFHIIGYCYGSIIGLELIYQLEQRNIYGHFFSLDGSASLLQTIIAEYDSNFNDEAMQMVIVKVIYDYINPELTPQKKIEMMALPGWNERMEKLSELFESLNYSKGHIIKVMNTDYNRIKIVAGLSITAQPKIKSPITLLKATIPLTKNIIEDYGLLQFTDGAFNIVKFNGNHTTILQNITLHKYINEFNVE